MKFYVNDYLFEILPNAAKKDIKVGNASIFSAATSEKIIENYKLVQSGNVQGNTDFIFLVNNYDAVCQAVKSHFKLIEAAGGIVENNGKLLLIYRLKKWDLPKGKMEVGEVPETTAVREVEEECGIQAKITKKIGETWHTYELKGNSILKCTHWYHMQSLGSQTPTPQTEEAIEQVKWVKKKEVSQLLQENSYASIIDIFQRFEAL